MDTCTKTFGGYDVTYRIGSVDEHVIQDSIIKDIFFSRIPEYRPSKDHVIIDVGAHIGTFSLMASSKAGEVHAIEPCKESFSLLETNISDNNCGNVKCHHLALTNYNGTCKLYHAPGNWGHSVVKKRSNTHELSQACTLESFMRSNKVDCCHFLKFNCEGSEFPVLIGTPDDVLARIGIILVLFHCDLWPHNTGEDLMRRLKNSGMRCDMRKRSKNRGWIVGVRHGF